MCYNKNRWHLTSALLGIEMAALAQEQLRVLLLDTKNGVVHIQTVYQGTPFHIPLRQERKQVKRWALAYAACINCGTTSIKHHGHGLCRRCVQRKKFNHLPPGSWSLSFACCQNCGTTSKIHKAHGLCMKCYQKRRRSN